MKRSTAHTRIAATVAAVGIGALIVPTTVGAEPPRPGCGYGDESHAHQAAPGRDPLGLRPGNGFGDPNADAVDEGDPRPQSRHTAPPGRAPSDGGDQSAPMRGCKESPIG